VLQQQPPTQMPFVHWSFAVHVAPEPGIPFAVHTPEEHQKLDAHSASVVQLPRQLVALAHSRLPVHAVIDAATHEPDPLH
jgi:hypothetical protein